MKLNNLLLLAPKKKTTRSHDGKVITLKSIHVGALIALPFNVLMEIECMLLLLWITCDREVISYVSSTIGIDGRTIRDLILESMEYRFGKIDVLAKPIQWLSDNDLVIQLVKQ
jgi:putative transposase